MGNRATSTLKVADIFTYDACGAGCSEIAVESGGKEFVGNAGHRSKGAAERETASIFIYERRKG